jgi:hypothetical protein
MLSEECGFKIFESILEKQDSDKNEMTITFCKNILKMMSERISSYILKRKTFIASRISILQNFIDDIKLRLINLEKITNYQENSLKDDKKFINNIHISIDNKLIISEMVETNVEANLEENYKLMETINHNLMSHKNRKSTSDSKKEIYLKMIDDIENQLDCEENDKLKMNYDFESEENEKIAKLYLTLREIKNDIMEKYDLFSKLYTNEMQVFDEYLKLDRKVKSYHQQLLNMIENVIQRFFVLFC